LFKKLDPYEIWQDSESDPDSGELERRIRIRIKSSGFLTQLAMNYIHINLTIV
jgi:hypothetical protein